MNSRIEVLEKGSIELGLELSQEQLSSFLKYKDLIQEWNQKIDITTIIDDVDIDIKHFLDSLTALKTQVFKGGKKLIDIGTGGGFPGLPLKIYEEDIDLTLLDSLRKRVTFLEAVVEELGLSQVKAIHGRAEELSRQEEHREKYDIAVSRAVAYLNTLAEYCLPFVKKGGYFLAMKGPDLDQELRESERAIKTLGGKIVSLDYVRLPHSDIVHSLVLIEKVKNTDKKYPRGQGKPRSKPL